MFTISHVGIVVSDIVRSADFYMNLIGCTHTETYESEDIILVYLMLSNQTLELICYKNPQERSNRGVVDHIAFEVEDIAIAIDRLRQAGIRFAFESPKRIHNKQIVFFYGPDGERLELIQLMS